MQGFEQCSSVERWGIFERILQGPVEENPFTDVQLSAQFSQGNRVVVSEGFYDGEGSYKIRFMPDTEGEWNYETRSNVGVLDGIKGKFFCIAPAAGNHGPVRVHNTYHFQYADGTPFFPFGTTCYAWIHQGDELEKQTLETLEGAPFNKIRMCIFPKNYTRNGNEPEHFPFMGTPPIQWDFTRFNPVFFKRLEKYLMDLMHLGIEADIILFHPYDKGRWGFDRMNPATDERYLRYIIARLAAYRNVWWSMANEYDYMLEKKAEDWDRFLEVVKEADPYQHLRSVHNGDILFDSWKPSVTHASVQLGTPKAGFGRYKMLRDAYKKPVIYDEVGYEGNIENRWGCLTPEEMVHRFWQGIIAGTYITHGETYVHPEDILWWAKGGGLHGKSPARIRFLRKIMEEGPKEGIDPIDKWWVLNAAGRNGEYYLYYFGCEKPVEWTFSIPGMKVDIPVGARFRIDVIDTWNMTITPVEGDFVIDRKERYSYTCIGNRKVELPGREYMALRIMRV